MQKLSVINFIALCLPLLSGCGVGEKSASMSIIYGVMALLSLGLLIAYFCITKQRSIWFLLLYSSIFVVNLGYFALSLSRSLEEALLANRIAYLGSVFLPMAMLMIILNVCKLHRKKWLPIALSAINVIVFLIAASPGYLDIYYKDVQLTFINGVAVLEKTYGSWHFIYLVFLLLYFMAIIIAIVHAFLRKTAASYLNASILAGAAGINIGVWLLEQLVRVDFEFLSVSYVISGFFLLALNMMIQSQASSAASQETPASLSAAETLLAELTPTERMVCTLYFEGKSSREIMSELCITENTLKYHNRNIYSKAGVSSRKELFALYKPE